MINLSILKTISYNKDYYKITIDIFQKYAYVNFENSSFLKAFQIDFKS